MPVSMRMSFEPVLTASVVNGIGSVSAAEEVVRQRLLHLRPGSVADELVVDLAVPHPVVERGQLVAADLVAV